MLDFLQNLDSDLLLWINGMHCSYFDSFMWTVSKMASWSLIAVVAIVINARKGWKPALFFVLALALAVALADQISSGLIKNLVERPRPTHAPELKALVHVVRDYRGGPFGFVSSHAANAFAVAVVLGCMLPHRAALGSLLAWASLQCYSRMYLGVHYPGDILCGAIVGVVVALCVLRAWKWAVARYCDPQAVQLTVRDSHAVSIAVWATVVVIAVISFM